MLKILAITRKNKYYNRSKLSEVTRILMALNRFRVMLKLSF
ncbi:hypothetical protein BSPWISOX_2311 [uncultured Gammaproteobacteria bacterium]|nr:hypothetical protein BSPWISOX_2311 [uncultured Gammaproteobacteria bacterium]